LRPRPIGGPTCSGTTPAHSARRLLARVVEQPCPPAGLSATIASRGGSMLKRAWLWGSIPLLLLAACGGSSGDDAAVDAGLPLAEVPEAYAAVFCDLSERCNPFFKAFVPEGDCEDIFIATLKAQGFDAIVDAVEDERARYDPAKMQDCL